jgi:flavin-dependent dehydrogenase
MERRAYPHHKVCGEFLSPECVPLLREMGVWDTIAQAMPATITRARITAPDGLCWEGDLPGTAIGFSRYRLDHLLIQTAQSAGVQVITETPVKAIHGNLVNGFQVETHQAHWPAQVVIGAYGKRSGLDRTLARPFLTRSHPYIAIKAHFSGDAIPHRVELHGFTGGYCGISEIEGGQVNLCLLARLSAFQAHGETIDRFITWMQTQNPYLALWLRTAHRVSEWVSIAQIPFVPKAAIEHDVLMSGDAAGLIAPLAGDGMGMALSGGKLIAQHLDRYLRGEWDADTLRQRYHAAWNRQFSPRLWWGRRLQAVMFRPHLLGLGLRVMQRWPALGSFFIRQTRQEAV